MLFQIPNNFEKNISYVQFYLSYELSLIIHIQMRTIIKTLFFVLIILNLALKYHKLIIKYSSSAL